MRRIAQETMEPVRAHIEAAFGALPDPPPMTLRAGNAIDDGLPAQSFDALLDTADASYLERHTSGLFHIDATSWRHYLPILMGHALDPAHSDGTSLASHTLLFSLRPPDRIPSRFAALTPDQMAAVRRFLEALASDPKSPWTGRAMTALDEYWAAGATYR